MSATIHVGTVLRSRYRVVQLLNQSRLANIYLVEDQHISGRVWAIREMPLIGADTFEKNRVMAQFHAEAMRLSQLSHPNLAKVLDFFVEGNNLYVVREFVHGTDLGKLLDGRVLPLSEREALGFVAQILDAISYIQGRKLPAIFFRELTAANIILSKTGSVKLLDLGLASLFAAGDNEVHARVGSLDYASPEQFSDNGVFDQRSLVYSVGAILYHMLTRRNPALSPFNLDPIDEVNPHLSSAMQELVHRCIENDPRSRFSSLQELKKQMQALIKVHDVKPGARRAPGPDEAAEGTSWNTLLGIFLILLMSAATLALYQYFFKA